MAKDKVWQDESVQIMKQVFSEGIEKRDARIAALEAGIQKSLDNLYSIRIMESQKRNCLIAERYSFTNPADAHEVEEAINRLAALLKGVK